MSQSQPVTSAFAESARQSAELHALRRMLDLSRGCFSLSIAVCNSRTLRDYLIGKLRADDPGIAATSCPPDTTDVFGAVAGAAQIASRTALFVVGLEDSVDSSAADHPSLRSLNASRELWERIYHCPIVFWVPDYVAALLAVQARDWWRYRSHSFEFVSDQADARSGVADPFAADVNAAAQLRADEKHFRIAELEQRVATAGLEPDQALVPHVLTWLDELGILCRITGQPRRAIEYHQRQLALARTIGSRRDEGAALRSLGNVHLALGDARQAIQLFSQDLAIAREIGSRGAEGTALNNLGVVHAFLGDAREAIRVFEQALAIAREIGDRGGEGAALGNLANAHADLGDIRRSIQLYERVLAIARENGDRSDECKTLGNLGLAHADLGDARQAIQFYEHARAVAREIGERGDDAKTSWNMGRAYETLGDFSRAADLMQVCVDYEREIGHANAERDAARVAALRARLK